MSDERRDFEGSGASGSGSGGSRLPPVRLPRLEIMDQRQDDSSPGRPRSISSAASLQQYHHHPGSSGPHSASATTSSFESISRERATTFTYSPSSMSIGLAPESSSHRSGPPPRLPSLAAVQRGESPSQPSLPRPSRSYSMLEGGALPPLSRINPTASPVRSSSSAYAPSYLSPSQSRPRGLTHSGGAASVKTQPHAYYHHQQQQQQQQQHRTPPWLVSPSSAHHNASYDRGHSWASHPGSGRPTGAVGSGSTDALTSSSAGPSGSQQTIRRVIKAHVSSACLNCKRAHLACDSERPCRRCSKLGKTATCVDVQHKKRGRPRIKDRDVAMTPATTISPVEGQPMGWPSPKQSGANFSPSSSSGSLPGSNSSTMMTPRMRTFSSASEQMNRSMSTTTPISQQSSYLPTPSNGPWPTHVSSVATTMLCGTDLVAAHVSTESRTLFGWTPPQLQDRHVADLIHAHDLDRFRSLYARLIEPVGLASTGFSQDFSESMKVHSMPLLLPAPGTIYLEDVFQTRTALDQRGWAPCSIRFHLGGCFGLDLFKPETKDRAIVVVSFCPYDDKAGGNMREPGSTGAGSGHPGVEQLHHSHYNPGAPLQTTLTPGHAVIDERIHPAAPPPPHQGGSQSMEVEPEPREYRAASSIQPGKRKSMEEAIADDLQQQQQQQRAPRLRGYSNHHPFSTMAPPHLPYASATPIAFGFGTNLTHPRNRSSSTSSFWQQRRQGQPASPPSPIVSRDANNHHMTTSPSAGRYTVYESSQLPSRPDQQHLISSERGSSKEEWSNRFASSIPVVKTGSNDRRGSNGNRNNNSSSTTAGRSTSSSSGNKNGLSLGGGGRPSSSGSSNMGTVAC